MMILYTLDKNGNPLQIQYKDQRRCLKDCTGCNVALHAYPSGKIISIGKVTADKKGRIKGVIVRLCPNPHFCDNIDRRIPAKDQLRNLLAKS